MVRRPPDPAGVGEIAVEDAALAPRKPEDENGRRLNNSGITTRREMRGVVIVTESLLLQPKVFKAPPGGV